MRYHVILLNLLLLISVFTGCREKKNFQDTSDLMIGVKVYNIDRELKSVFEEWENLGINTVFASPSIFNDQFSELAKKHDIETFVILPVFYDPDTLQAHPDSIPNTCFCTYCLEKFQSDKNISIPESLVDVNDIAGWIKANHQAEWIDWKCSLITGMVRNIVTEAKKVKPEVKVNLHGVPWRQDDFDNAIRRIVAQDFSALTEYCDIISPMTYSHMLKREPKWIHSVVKDITGQVNCKVIPSIQVNEAYLTNILSAEEFEQTLIEALKPPSSGVFLWSWEQLEKVPEKKEIMKKVLSF